MDVPVGTSNNPEDPKHAWVNDASFAGLSDAEVAAVVIEHLGSDSSPLDNSEILLYYGHLQRNDAVQREYARHRLRSHLLPLAIGICKTYPPIARSLPRAMEGIDLALQRWKPEQGFKLGSVASWLIRQEITRNTGTT